MEGPTKTLGPPVCPLPGQELLTLGGQLHFVPLPNATLFTLAALRTGNPISHSPRECQAHPEGKNPEEVIKGDGVSSPATDKQQQGGFFFFSRGHV